MRGEEAEWKAEGGDETSVVRCGQTLCVCVCVSGD